MNLNENKIHNKNYILIKLLEFLKILEFLLSKEFKNKNNYKENNQNVIKMFNPFKNNEQIKKGLIQQFLLKIKKVYKIVIKLNQSNLALIKNMKQYKIIVTKNMIGINFINNTFKKSDHSSVFEEAYS